MIGQNLNNRYTITARLGKGAMGTVYRATDSKADQDVAIKVIASELAVDPDMLERFKREGEALRQLRHVNIVGYMDAFEHDEHYVIVMEYVPGGSLYELIKAGPLPIERATQIALDLCDALIRSHRLKIIHRDIKPENVLIAEDGTPKLADFGVARLSEGTRMTRSGMQVGTPYYMAPEAWEGKTLDAQADIWSLGVLLFEMLSGQVPFGGDTPLAIMTKVSTTPPPDLKKLRADVPSGLVRIIGRMLTRDKRRRYQTMREVAVELERDQQLTTPVPQKAKRGGGQAVRKDIITKNLKIALPGFRSSLNNVQPYLRTMGILGVVIALTYLLLVNLMADPVAGHMIFSGTSAGEVRFYIYDNTFDIIDPGGGNNWDPVQNLRGETYFTSDRDGKAEIYRLIDGIPQRVTVTPGQFESWGPAFSSRAEVYFTSDRDGKAEVYRLINGIPQRVTVTPGQFESWGPAFSSRGEIYFTSNRDGKAEIYRLLNGIPQRVTVTPESFESWGPAFNSRGELYFTSNRDGKAEVYRLINGIPQRVTDTPGQFESWSPVLHGLNIYFTSNRSNRKEVYLLKPQIINISNIESWTNFSADFSDEKSPNPP